jgi:hypothetical protein
LERSDGRKSEVCFSDDPGVFTRSSPAKGVASSTYLPLPLRWGHCRSALCGFQVRFAWTHYYARALAKEGITANSVAPALIETDMIADNPAATPDLIPIGRIGQVQEVVDVVMLVVSNGYLTGQTLSVNGGVYMT